MENQDLQKLLHPTSGMFDPSLRFAFTNVLDQEFVSYWGGQPIRVAAGKTVELSHHLAVKMVREIVDRIMSEESHKETVEGRNETRNPYFESPKSTLQFVPSARWPYEQKVCKLLDTDAESPEIASIRAELKAELLANANSEPSKQPPPSAFGEFAEINAGVTNTQPKKVEKKPIRVKEIKE